MAGFTVAYLEAIEAAIGTGELSVDYQGRRTTYRSMTELMQARDLIKAELIAAGLLANPMPSTTYAVFDKE